MPRYTMLISTNSLEGRDDDYNAWYDDRHLPDVLSLEGFRAAQRFRVAGAEPPLAVPGHRYLAMYEVEADSIGAATKILTDGFAAGRLPLSDSLDNSSIQILYLEPLTERRTS